MEKIVMGTSPLNPSQVAKSLVGQYVTIRTNDHRSPSTPATMSVGRIKSVSGANGSKATVTYTNGTNDYLTWQSTVEVAQSVEDEMRMSQFTD